MKTLKTEETGRPELGLFGFFWFIGRFAAPFFGLSIPTSGLSVGLHSLTCLRQRMCLVGKEDGWMKGQTKNEYEFRFHLFCFEAYKRIYSITMHMLQRNIPYPLQIHIIYLYVFSILLFHYGSDRTLWKLLSVPYRISRYLNPTECFWCQSGEFK